MCGWPSYSHSFKASFLWIGLLVSCGICVVMGNSIRDILCSDLPPPPAISFFGFAIAFSVGLAFGFVHRGLITLKCIP